MSTLTATLTVGNVWTRIETDATTLAALDREFAAFKKGYERTWLYKSRQWDGKTHFIVNGLFRSGLVQRVKEHLDRRSVAWQVDFSPQSPQDGRKLGEWHIPSLDDKPTAEQDWSHQRDACEMAISAGRGIIYDATGTGKTEIMARLAQRLNRKTLFLCDQRLVAQQSAERFKMRLGIDIGLWASGKHDDGQIVCGTFQTMASALKRKTPKLLAWLNSFDVLLIDETHHLTGETYQAVVDAVGAYYRFGFSATPFRKAHGGGNDLLTELHVVGSTGEVIHEFDAVAGIKAGILTPPIITMHNWHIDPSVGRVVTPRMDWERADFTLNDDAYEYGNRRGNSGMMDGLYTTGIMNYDERNLAVLDAIMLFVDEGLTTLVLMDKVPHGHRLLEMTREALHRDDIEFIHGSSSDAERAAALERLANQTVPVLLANVIADEGLDVPAISAMVLAGGQKAGHRYLQRIGRGMRLMKGKEVLQVVDFLDTHSKTLWLQSLSRKKTYQDAGHKVLL